MRPFFAMYRNIKLFEPLVYLTILLNTVALCLVWPGQSTYTVFTLQSITTICFALYVAEAIIKIAAMRKLYFDDLWNRFDFMVVLLSVLFLLLKIYASLNLGLAITGIRAFRFLKLLKGRLPSLWLIVKTFMVALQPLMSVGCMLILVLYIYTIAGV